MKAIISDWDQCRHLTLTLRSSEEPLGEQIDHLLGAFRRLRQRRFWKAKVHGGIGTVEVTYNASANQWHPHLHVLMDGRYMEHSTISNEWSIVTGGSFVVHVSAVHSREDAGRYIAKYVTKPSSMPELSGSRTVELALALAGRRTLITFGTAHNAGLPVTDPAPGHGGSKHLCSVHVLIRAYRAGNTAAEEIVTIAAEYMPLLARLITGGTPSGLPPPPVQESEVNESLRSLISDVNWWDEHGESFHRHRIDRARSVPVDQTLF